MRFCQPEAAEFLGVDTDTLAFGLLVELVLAMDREQAAQLARDALGKSVPPKRMKDAAGFIAYRWVTDDRAFLEPVVEAALEEEVLRGGETAEIAGRLPPIFAAAVVTALGRPLEELAAVGEDWVARAREAADHARRLLHAMKAQRQDRLAWAGTSAERAADRIARQRTRGLLREMERLRTKAARAEDAVGSAVRRERERAAALRAEADALRREAEALRQEVESLRQECREREAEVAFLRRRVRELSTLPAGERLPLAGQGVLVVGDPGHWPDYRRVCRELGADEVGFLDGFGNPAEAAARAWMATVVLLVTAFASHKMTRALEATGAEVVAVPVAGVDSLRRSALAWARRDAQTPA